MEQTFLTYVSTDVRFWLSSLSAVFRSLLVPACLILIGASIAGGAGTATPILLALLVSVFCDWVFLVLRMARRIALGVEEPNALLDRSVVGNARYLYSAYFTRTEGKLRTA